MPTDRSDGVYIFNEQHAVALIMLIHAKGEVLGLGLREVSGNYPKLKLVADELKEQGLIEIQVQKKPRLVHIYKLTEKGKTVAELLNQIDKAVKSED
jgi:uncharacterized protein involved in propanediol utilization